MEIKSIEEIAIKYGLYHSYTKKPDESALKAMEEYAQQFQVPTDVLTTEIVVLREKNAELVEMLKEAKSMIGKLRRSMSVHPDCTVGSEFDDYTTDAQNLEDEIE